MDRESVVSLLEWLRATSGWLIGSGSPVIVNLFFVCGRPHTKWLSAVCPCFFGWGNGLLFCHTLHQGTQWLGKHSITGRKFRAVNQGFNFFLISRVSWQTTHKIDHFLGKKRYKHSFQKNCRGCLLLKERKNILPIRTNMDEKLKAREN